MGANIKFAWENLYTAPTTILVAQSSVSALPVAATQNPDRNYAWRSETDVIAQRIDVDFGAIVPISIVALANVVTMGSGVVALYQRGDAGTAGTAVLVATFAAEDRDTRAVAAIFAVESHRHWQLRWTNPTGVSSYASLGFAFFGTYDEPTVNVMVPMPMARQDPALASQSVDGQESFALRTKFMTGAVAFDAVLEAQFSQLREMFDAIGVSTPLFIVLDTALGWTTWLVRFTAALSWEIEPGGALGRYGAQIPWKEVR